MKEFTREMLEKLTKANDDVKGTPYYITYHMEKDMKFNGRWKFFGHGVPHQEGKIKTVGLTTYIITTDSYGMDTRYAVNLNVKELLGI